MFPVGPTVEGGQCQRWVPQRPHPTGTPSRSRTSPMATRLGCSWLGKDSSTSYAEASAESSPDCGSLQRCSSSCTNASSRGLEARCGSLESSLKGGQKEGQAQVQRGASGKQKGQADRPLTVDSPGSCWHLAVP